MKIHPWQLASWQFDTSIHPVDFTAAVNARIRQKFADSKRRERNPKRKERNPKTIQAIEEELYVTRLAGEGINFWSNKTCNDMFLYAMMNGAGQFFMKLGKAMLDGKTDLFDQLDIFILENWRQGYCLRDKTRADAVKILRKQNSLKSLKPLRAVMAGAKEFYATRIKRNGLSQGATS